MMNRVYGDRAVSTARRTPQGPWRWSLRSEPALDFAVQILVGDGLQVPPFDRHMASKGDLLRAGMHPDDWVEWVDRLAAAVLSKRVVGDKWKTYSQHPNPLPVPDVHISEVGRLIGDESDSVAVSNGYPQLTFYLVGYMRPAVYLARPDIAMIGDNSGALTSSEVADSIRYAIGVQPSGSNGT